LVTTTAITERGAVSSPSYTAAATVSCPTYTARDTVTNPFYQGTSETGTDTTAPVLTNFHANVISFTYVEFDWDTDEPANCRIQYGTTNPPGGADSTVSHTHLILTQRAITATGLTPGTTYYVRARSLDAYDNSGASDVHVFTTADTGDAGGRPIVV